MLGNGVCDAVTAFVIKRVMLWPWRRQENVTVE